MRLLSVREHDRLTIGPVAGADRLTEAEAQGLERITPHLPPGALTWERRAVKLGAFCGVLRAGNLTIEVLPKLPGHEASPTRHVLIQMLHAAGESLAGLAGDAALGLQSHHLLDVFIGSFCAEVNQRLRQGTIRRYIAFEDNLTRVRGRIAFAEHMRRNALRRQLVYCRYEELTVDNVYTQALKHVLARLDRLAGAPAVRRQTNELLRRFDDVTNRPVSAADVEALVFDRTLAGWAPVYRQCARFLRGLFPDVLAGSTDAVCLLFDMNRLFEAFVAARARRDSQGRLTVHTQGPERELARDARDAPVFPLRPDLVFAEPGGRVMRIADTKWKRLEASGQLGIAAADIQQMLAYAVRYACGDVALLYPAQDALPPGATRIFRIYGPPPVTVRVLALDLPALANGASLPPALLGPAGERRG